jgi:hypothetical protein
VVHNSKRKPPNTRINKEDGKIILELWKTMTAKQIAEKYPMYNSLQISRYCSSRSNFLKRGSSKQFIDKLKSYNGTKTLKEIAMIVKKYPSEVKRICENHNIPYKQELK